MHRLVMSALSVTFLCMILLPGILSTARAQDSFWQAPAEAAGQINPTRSDPASIKRGKALFIKYCASCHGEEGSGDGPVAIRLITEPPDFTSVKIKQTDGELAWKIITGRNPMPKWKDRLNSSQIWDIVNFIQHLRAKD